MICGRVFSLPVKTEDMKKILIISGMLISFFTTTQAQTYAGIKAGLNLSNMFIEEVNDENLKAGFNAGAFLHSELTEGVFLQPEINFTTKGSSVDYNYGFGQGVTKYNFNYVEIPVLVGVELGPIFRMEAGPYGGFLINGKVVNDADDDIFDFDERINRDDFNSFDFGLAFGIGIGNDQIEFNARYNYGLNEIGNTDSFNGLSYSLRNAHHSVWQFDVAIGF